MGSCARRARERRGAPAVTASRRSLASANSGGRDGEARPGRDDASDARLRGKAGSGLPDCHGCDRCGDLDEGHLYVRLARAYWLCARCYVRAGRPSSRHDDQDAAAVHAAELAAHERMAARGGADAYRVRAGKA